MSKKIYYFGLGRMGKAMVENLHEKGWEIVGYDVSQEARESVRSLGIEVVDSVEELFAKRDGPMTLWFQIPHAFVGEMLDTIESHVQSGDVIVDAGNSPFKRAVERSERFAQKEVAFMDIGISGGVEGARNGACMMIGGPKQTFDDLESLFADIALPEGYQYLGEAGAGHFVKMVHNGIEYGMMQAIAEGFDIMSQSDYNLDLPNVARIYQRESIITSRLIGWLAQGFDVYGTDLKQVSGSVGANGEGLWTIETAHEMGMKVPAIESSLEERKQSQENPTYRGKLLQTMRAMFGGHAKDTGVKS